MNNELHDKAWNLLEEKGLKLSERIMVRSHFASAYKEDYPNIEIKYNKGSIEYYHSSIDMIKNFAFQTEKEVILANAIYENMNEINGQDEFIQILKFTFRLMGIENNWTK